MRYYIANWKANKNLSDAQNWISVFLELLDRHDEVKNKLATNKICVIIAPPAPHLADLGSKIKPYSGIRMGAQDVSAFEEGAYTGEITAKSLTGLATYAIVGHSERRRFFGEKDKTLFEKTGWARRYGMEVIYCVQNPKEPIPQGVNIVAYEPPVAIGSGKNEEVTKVLAAKQEMKISDSAIFIYGGSVNSGNISTYRSRQEINGFLIATASLDPVEFFKIIQA